MNNHVKKLILFCVYVLIIRWNLMQQIKCGIQNLFYQKEEVNTKTNIHNWSCVKETEFQSLLGRVKGD